MRAPLAVLVLLGVAGVSGLIGFRAGRQSLAATTAPTPGADLSRAAPSSSRTDSPGAAASPPRPVHSLATPTAGSRVPTPGKLELLRAMKDLQNRNLAGVNITLIDFQGRITPAFRELFGLTDAEEQTLQQTVTRVRDDLERFRNQNSAVKVNADNVVLAVAPFSGGADLYDQVMDQFAATLGPERYPLFVGMQEQQMQWVFGQFGAQARTSTVTRIRLLDGNTTLFVKEESRGASMSTSGGSSFRTLNDLVKQHPVLAPYADQIAQLPVKPNP